MKRKAENLTKIIKKPRHSLVAVLSDQNQQYESEMRKFKLGRSIAKVLKSLGADTGRDYGQLLYNYLPGDQRKKAAEMAAFCYFVQQRHQIFVQKSSKEKAVAREGIFQEKFFTLSPVMTSQIAMILTFLSHFSKLQLYRAELLV